jgi:thymidylate synthase (FAD)
MTEMKYLTHTDVLDFGFVRLVSYMGDDVAVVQAARVSFGKGATEPERDRKLIHFLLANRHETPFEHAVFKFHIKCPIFVARQWFRHRMASYNEISGRYVEMKEEFCLPERLRTQKARHYRYEQVDEPLNTTLLGQMKRCYDRCYELYKELLQAGVAKEHARLILPLSLYTQFYWTVNARSLMNFLSLRMDEHAQYEIQQYAGTIAESFREKMPMTFEAFERYVLTGEKWGEDG